jgi:hypothetical protein
MALWGWVLELAALIADDGRVEARDDASGIVVLSGMLRLEDCMGMQNSSRQESNDRCRFHISTKFENKVVRSLRLSMGLASESEDTKGVKKC